MYAPASFQFQSFSPVSWAGVGSSAVPSAPFIWPYQDRFTHPQRVRAATQGRAITQAQGRLGQSQPPAPVIVPQVARALCSAHSRGQAHAVVLVAQRALTRSRARGRGQAQPLLRAACLSATQAQAAQQRRALRRRRLLALAAALDR